MSGERPSPDKISSSFEQLKAAATRLNAASDALGGTIAALDDALKTLNLGIWAWVTVSKVGLNNGDCILHRLGYARVGSKWGIALSRSEFNEYVSEEDGEAETWLFNDAPRALRVEAVGKLPSLLDALTERAQETADQIAGTIARAEEVVAAVGSVGRNVVHVSKAHPPIRPVTGYAPSPTSARKK